MHEVSAAPVQSNGMRTTSLTCFRHGIRGLVIDPYNELDHTRPPHIQETEYISSMLSKVDMTDILQRRLFLYINDSI
jgi:hypothetical protein